MTDMYSELLVKKETTGKDQAIKILIIALIVLTAAAGLLITPLAWVLTIGLGIAAYFVLPLLIPSSMPIPLGAIQPKRYRGRLKSIIPP